MPEPEPETRPPRQSRLGSDVGSCRLTAHNYVLIASFRLRGLKALYEGLTARRVAPEHVAKLRDVLAALDFGRGPVGMDPPGLPAARAQGAAVGALRVVGVQQLECDLPL